MGYFRIRDVTGDEVNEASPWDPCATKAPTVYTCPVRVKVRATTVVVPLGVSFNGCSFLWFFGIKGVFASAFVSLLSFASFLLLVLCTSG